MFWFGHRGGLHQTNSSFCAIPGNGRCVPTAESRKNPQSVSRRGTTTSVLRFPTRISMRPCGPETFQSLFHTHALTHTNARKKTIHISGACVLCPVYLHGFTNRIVAGKGARWGSGSTYPLVQVDGVLARHHVGDGRAALLAGLDVGHLWRMLAKLEEKQCRQD